MPGMSSNGPGLVAPEGPSSPRFCSQERSLIRKWGSQQVPLCRFFLPYGGALCVLPAPTWATLQLAHPGPWCPGGLRA